LRERRGSPASLEERLGRKKTPVVRRSASDIVRLARFLYSFLRGYWGLFVLAAVFTAINAAAYASRAAFAGAFQKYVIEGGKHASRAAPKLGALESWLAEHTPLGSLVEWWERLRAAHLPAPDDTIGWAKLLGIGLAAVSVIMAASEYGKDLLQSSLVLRVINAIRERVCGHLLSLSLRFYHRQRIGDLYSRLTNDIQRTQDSLNFLFGDIFEDAFRIAACTALCIATSWRLSAISLLAIPAVIVPLQVFARKLRKSAKKRQISQADVTEAMQQMLTGMRIVKAFHAEQHEAETFHNHNETFIRKALRVVRMKALARGFSELINHLVAVALLVGGVFFVARKAIGMDELMTFLAALMSMYAPSKKLIRAYTSMQESLAGLDRIEELLEVENDTPDAPGAKPLPPVRGDVRIVGVSFRYGAEPVLKDISIEARAGEVIGIAGPSGAGKSTLVDLIARFYDPDEGRIEIDGHDIRGVTRASLLRHMAMVTQDPFLFNDTVIENVRYGRRDASLAEVEAACRAAGVHDVIAALPQGYETVVGERGVTLSGGQRQRITIARALLRDPRILLLDEATSALDSESEKLVQEALERLMAGRTTFVVAHRLSTIVGADRIVVLDRGRVVEEGRHDDLVRRGGLYAKLWRLQSGGEPAAAAAAAAESRIEK
jgi:subfamily B ATP-binding cassette protein MsbA